MNLLQSFLFILIYENKYYLEVYIDNCAYKIVNSQIVDYLNDIDFESDYFCDFMSWPYKCCIMKELILVKELIKKGNNCK